MRPPALKPVLALVLALGFCRVGTPAQAQTAPGDTAKTEEQPIKLERFEITGTYIPLASTQTALPLTTLDAKVIANTGIATNVLEVLRKTAPQFSGNGNLGNSNANAAMGSTGGGSKLAFRNTQTLVLVNGRRMSYSPILSSGGAQFVDVNLIPLSAIERIEILQDGASATYGTDAVAGVVNIILKTDFKGFETSARYGFSANSGHYEERKFSVMGGAGTDKTALTVSAEYTASDPLFQYERGFSNPIYNTTGFAGVVNTPPTNTSPPLFYVLNPSLNAPPAGHTDLATLVASGVYLPVNGANLGSGTGTERQYAFNLANYVTLLLENQRRSATLNLDHRVNDQLTMFGDLIYTKTDTFAQLNAQPLMPQLPASNSSNPTTQTLQVRNRFVTRPRLFSYKSTSLRGIVGARGSFTEHFKWEAAANKNIVDQSYTNANVVNSTLRAAAVANGLINLAARVQPAGALEAAGFFGTAWGQATSTLATADARVTGELLHLPAGPVGIAVGTEYRVETLKQSSDVNSQTATFNWDSGVSLNPFDRNRSVWSSFAEVRIPLLGEKQSVPLAHALELSAAVRHERYSDTDDPTVPKFSLAWRPFRRDLLLRATYSRSFSAPTLFNLFGPTSIANAIVIPFDRFGGGAFRREVQLRSGANPDLLPSRSKNQTFGAVWSPKAVKGLSVTADLFDIQQTDRIAAIGSTTIVQHVELNGAASPYARFVKIGAFDGTAITAPGQISAANTGNIYVTDRLVNIASLKLNGVDLKLEYSRGSAALGRLDASVSVATYQSYSVQSLPSVAEVETVGRATIFNGTIPRWQSYAALGWSRSRWRANLGWQHIPGVIDPLGDGTERKPFAIRAYDSFDLSASYAFGSRWKWLERLTLRLGANNVLNAPPPFGGGTFAEANADTAAYSPIGRLLFVEGRYKF